MQTRGFSPFSFWLDSDTILTLTLKKRILSAMDYLVKRKAIKRITLSLLLTVFLIGSTGCASLDRFVAAFSQSTEEDQAIKIGVFEPLSGADQEAGRAEIQGIQLAHELYPTVLGKKVELVYEDNRSEIGAAEAAAKQLTKEEVVLVLGSYGNTLSLAGGPYFLEAGIPAIAITNRNPLVTKGNPYYFRVSYVDSFQGVMAAKYVFNDLGLTRAVVMKSTEDDYGSAMSQSFSDKLVALTGDPGAVYQTIEYHQGTTDFSAQIAALKASAASVVFLPDTAKVTATIVKQVREAGLSVQFIGTDLWKEGNLLKDAGEAAEGLVFTTYFDPGTQVTEETEAFLSAYQAKYGQGETPDSAVALGFDAYLLALDAIKRQAEQENTDLQLILSQTKEFPGATGRISFDENGDPIKSVVFITVENGEFIHKYTAEPEWN